MWERGEIVKLKPYNNVGCAFIHDDRGRFVPVGSVAWLREDRAEQIIHEGAAPGVLEPVKIKASLNDSESDRGELFPLSADKAPVGDRSNLTDLINQFLALHHSRRKKLAKLLGAKGRIKASTADKYIRAAKVEDLREHIGLLGGV